MKLLLIATLFLLSVSTAAFADKCIASFEALSFKIDGKLETALQDFAQFAIKYQNSNSSDPQSITLHKLIIQKLKEMDAVLNASGYSKEQKREIGEFLLSNIQNIIAKEDANRASKTRAEKAARDKESGIIKNFKEERSLFTETLNKSFRSEVISVDRILLSHDGRYYIAIQPFGVLIVDSVTGAPVGNIRDSKGYKNIDELDFDLSQDGRFIVYVEGFGKTKSLKVYKVSIDETIQKNKVGQSVIIDEPTYKVREGINLFEYGLPWALLSQDRFLIPGGLEKPLVLSSIAPTFSSVEYEHPDFKTDAEKKFYSWHSIDSSGKHIAINHGRFIGIYDLDTGIHQFDLKYDPPNLNYRLSKIAFSPDGKKMAAIGSNPIFTSGLVIWSIEKAGVQEKFIQFPTDEDFYRGSDLDWSPDGSLIAVSHYVESVGPKVKIYSSMNSEVPLINKLIGGKTRTIKAIKFSPLGDRVLAVDNESTVHVFKNEATK